MKKFKYLLLIMLATFMSVTSVNAATVSINGGSVGTSIEVPSFMTYYDITSSTSVSMLSTSSNPTTLTYSANFTTVTNSYGGIMAMKVNTPFVKDFYYAITVYNWTTGAYGQLSTIPTVGISDGMRNASQAALVGDGAWTLFRGIAGTAEICNYDRQTLQSFCGNATAYTFIIKATYTADAIAFPYTTDPTCYNCLNTFYGYSIDSLGSKDDGITTQDVQNAINSSNLATASSIAEVQTSIQEVKQEINGMQQQQQQTNEKLDDLNENITSDDVSKSEDEASSFFDNFSTTDNGGISSIVTSPLVAIEKMLSGTCEPLTATYSGKTLSLPCGNSFWNGMSEIRTFLNLILGGFLCYGILSKLYLLIDRLKNPEDDRVDVMKL